MASNNSSTYVEWKWQSNLDPYASHEEAEWSSYLEEESEMIERAYKNGERVYNLTNHYIDFELSAQIRTKDTTKRRPVKRLVHDKGLWIKRIRKLGAGGFGTVYQGIYRGSQEVAYKVTKKQLSQAAQSEANILKTLRHPNIVQYIDVIHTSHHTLLVMELIDGDTLWTYIRNTPKSTTYWGETRDKMIDVAYAMSYLHEKNVVHADLKSDNILLRKRGGALLSDFGLSKVFQDSEAYNSNLGRGALRWLAPELCHSRPEKCSFESDVWAFGCVLMEIITSELPWNEFERTKELLQALADERYGPTFQEICRKLHGPEKLRKILGACCTWFKHNRPNFDKIIRDLRSIDSSDLQHSNQRCISAKTSSTRPFRDEASPTSNIPKKTGLISTEPLYSDKEDDDDSFTAIDQNDHYSSRSQSAAITSRRYASRDDYN